MQELTCDYCGKVLGEFEGFRLFYRHASILSPTPHDRRELCNDCGAKFAVWIDLAFKKGKLNDIKI